MRVFKAKVRFVMMVAVFLSGLIMGGCALQINYSCDPGMNFTGLRSYTWDFSSDLNQQHPLIFSNVQFFADKVLQEKGFNKSSEKPDFVISIDYFLEIGSYSKGNQFRMLALKIHRVGNKELSWRGEASGTINTNTESSDLKKSVQGILSKFPPDDSSNSTEEAANKFSALPEVEKVEPDPHIKSSHVEGKVEPPPISSTVKEENSTDAYIQSTEVLPVEKNKQEYRTEGLPAITPQKITTNGRYAVQIKAYPESKKNDAMVFVKDMRKEQPDIHVERVVLSGRGVWYRIMIGHFASAEDARRYMKEKKIIDAHPGSFVQLKSAEQSSVMQTP
jgi:hypothetical protein